MARVLARAPADARDAPRSLQKLRRPRVEDAPVRGGRGVRRRGRARGRARARSTPRGAGPSGCRRSTSSHDPRDWLARVDASRDAAAALSRGPPRAVARRGSPTASTALDRAGGGRLLGRRRLASRCSRSRPTPGSSPIAVHVDHGLRAGSGGDADVVARGRRAARRARSRSVRVAVDAGPEPRGPRARRARYDALERGARRARRRPRCSSAHTADDQAETVLLNVLRGAAAAGLAGMAPRRGHVVRPLLGLRRAETPRAVRRARARAGATTR